MRLRKCQITQITGIKGWMRRLWSGLTEWLAVSLGLTARYLWRIGICIEESETAKMGHSIAHMYSCYHWSAFHLSMNWYWHFSSISVAISSWMPNSICSAKSGPVRTISAISVLKNCLTLQLKDWSKDCFDFNLAISAKRFGFEFRSQESVIRQIAVESPQRWIIAEALDSKPSLTDRL